MKLTEQPSLWSPATCYSEAHIQANMPSYLALRSDSVPQMSSGSLGVWTVFLLPNLAPNSWTVRNPSTRVCSDQRQFKKHIIIVAAKEIRNRTILVPPFPFFLHTWTFTDLNMLSLPKSLCTQCAMSPIPWSACVRVCLLHAVHPIQEKKKLNKNDG